ncbi:hypothetical protein [Saccharopolyspora hattusasensis]|uniref:hypothetical protein n=1 Tax=Saccharopolyspora hattusasensis TaxID=1128679 RepID=UPI003D9881CC
MTDPSPLLGFARGDENAARHLQDRFRIIQERSPDPHIRALAGKVLSGASNPREALRDPAFGKFLAAGVQKGMQKIKSLSDEDRRKLAQQGEREYREIGLKKAPEPAQQEYDHESYEPDSFGDPPAGRRAQPSSLLGGDDGLNVPAF